ncbi:MAG: hypothetical protein ACRDOA_13420 [Streptosporangiaceae bacterium]
MDIKGVCYDTGRAYGGGFVTRRVFDPAMTRRELQIIRDDLHCNAVRFQGTDIGRLMAAATAALELGGLQVWLSPELFKKSRKATIAYLARAAAAAEPLRERFPGRLVFCVGTESSLHTKGIVPGRTVSQRIASIRRAGLRSGPYASELQAFLAEATDTVRKAFQGPVTYASLPFEVVDWSRFDVIGVDHYRHSRIDEHRYAETIRRYLGQGKPVVNAEFGHSSYTGDRPGQLELGEAPGLSVLLHRIPLAGRLVRPRLKKGTHVRDEEHQARELAKTLAILDAEGADGAFIWTFADPWLTYSADPRHDLDMTATSLVRTYERGHGTTYPGLPWEPKPAFGVVARFYATH